MTTSAALRERHIPFSSLQAATEAFIDYAIPECTPKFNYALIGPGVSQNPKQPVNLREPHGFQVGGVRMLNGGVNPPHMHFSCEVFICTRGDWRIQWGFNPEVLHADIGAGDIVSVPTWLYRGFTNIGADDGFLFTALGRDRTGGILWGASTLARAAEQGVLLSAEHRIIDTRRGESLRDGERLFQPMTEVEAAALRAWPLEAMSRRLVRWADLAWSPHALLDSPLPGCGGQIAPVVGLGLIQDRDAAAPVAHSHGVSLEWLRLPPGGQVSRHRLAEKQVLTVWQGELTLSLDAEDGPCDFLLNGRDSGWDSFSVPADIWRSLRNNGSTELRVLLMTAGDHHKFIEWDLAVQHAAAQLDWAVDADGFVAPKRFVDRAQ